ncbi:unnamed protein product [Caenorhabditis auriculariae]|uniref:Uncharacterized protein n=1 Tax=Caenorhabditis auriculariae TaxID=2777116 RepID=A0A8S1GZR9_9PELO|nr:unnamed protein product [Caenorhabditis auriculariae]
MEQVQRVTGKELLPLEREYSERRLRATRRSRRRRQRRTKKKSPSIMDPAEDVVDRRRRSSTTPLPLYPTSVAPFLYIPYFLVLHDYIFFHIS